MNGDIKLATLSDTDDTDLVGSELVTNGTFDTDISGWSTDGTDTIVFNSGLATITTNATGSAGVYQAITTVAGKAYTLSFSYSNNTHQQIYVKMGSIPEAANIKSFSKSGLATFSSGVLSTTFVATGTTTYISFGSGGSAPNYFDIDNVSVRLAEPDRSVNGNGLQVLGTVVKSPVATGADLMAYSGFTASSYLIQPYNSDLDFGTGDFCIMGWFDLYNTYSTLISRGDTGSTEGAWRLWNHAAGVLRFYWNNGVSEVYGTQASIPIYGRFTFLVIKRENGVLSISQDTKELTSFSHTDTLTCADASLRISGRSDGTDPAFNTKVALLRISATAPTPEQIAKIYEDERVLFQENAKATLYGTSNAVTALAYDEDTNLLHVGTSSGRSDFKGLRRINNTTDAVGVAISASNGLVVEE
jgi:hypothetical protein